MSGEMMVTNTAHYLMLVYAVFIIREPHVYIFAFCTRLCSLSIENSVSLVVWHFRDYGESCGSSSGIGRETARQLAVRGAKVTITGRNAEALAETKRILVEAGAKENDVLEVLGDIMDDEFAPKIVDDTIATFGRLDVLVNNAGARIPDPQNRPGIEQPVQILDHNFALNVRTVVVISQRAVEHLERTRGSIVNVSSLAGQPFVFKLSPYYPVAKAALDQLTVQMAGTLIEKGIRVNSVSPGVIKTNAAHRAGLPKDKEDEFYDNQGKDTDAVPLGRIGEAADIAKLIVFLADRSQSEFIVGQRYTADGGSSLKMVLATGPRS